MVTPLSQPPPDTPPGETPLELQELAADFAIEGELGRGGTAVVYRARERALDRVVAIKVIRAPYVGDDDLVARLEREARLVARLDHPNVVALLGVRRLHHGSLALVMRYVHGHTLRTELQRRGALPLARAQAVVHDVGLALAAAHAHGIVHRDVKPENIHIEHGAQRALLADFGAATPLRGDLRLTVAGMAIGTPGYMAPELIDGGDATPASDVYGLGLVAWEMLAGRAPWEGDSLFAVLSFRKQGRLVELDSLRDDVPPTVAAAIAGALHPDPAQRWPDIHRFLDELARPTTRRWLGGGSASASGSRRQPLFAAPLPTASDAGQSSQGGIGKPAAEQPTMRLTRGDRDARDARGDTLPIEAPPAAAPPPAPIPAPPVAEAHPSVAVFAADDEPDFEFADLEAPVTNRWRRTLAVIVVLLLVASTAVVGRYYYIADRSIATVAEAGGDVPASFTLPPPTQPVPRPDPAAAVTAPAASPAEPGLVGTDSVATDSLSRSASPVPPPAVAAPAPPRPAAASSAPMERSGARATAPIVAPTVAPIVAPPAASPPAASPPAATGRAASATRLGLGGLHSCAILGDGRLRCWGADDKGQLGPSASDGQFTGVAAGVIHSCARSIDGRTLCWGANARGQLGDGTRTAHQGARLVAGAGDQTALALGASHSCALTRDGGVECWGANDVGQLGNGERRDRSIPTPVAGDVRFTAVAAGWRHNCALATDGRALCWGDNAGGQLGDGTTESHDTPTPINSSLRFRALAAGRAHSCGLATTGELYCWGRNDTGQLGTGSRRDATTPRQVALTGTIRQLVAGSMHSCVLATDGVASCWGQNRYGQLGDGTTVDRVAPVRVAGTARFVELEASGAHSCGRTGGGEVYCWGYNIYGQLGDGTRQNRLRPVAVTFPP